MIELKQVSKTFHAKGETVFAVKDVSLNVVQGEIFGIIGHSGAGKSTLIRCLNHLEVPTKGSVVVNGQPLEDLSSKQLRQARKKIGMIFQHFNLLRTRTVFDNVAYPLKHSGLSKEEIKDKVTNLLRLVHLEDKGDVYPNQLSGGQKQRVAIARALANDPSVLLCDEATSALDPKTTKSILELLKELNESLGLTIVLITHQMEVVKEICHRVAVMEKGEIIEQGSILQVFSNPQSQTTKAFISSLFHDEKIYHLLNERAPLDELYKIEKLVKLSFIGQNTGQAFISYLAKTFEVDGSILFGHVEIIQQTPVGNLIVSFHGTESAINHAIRYLENSEITVEVLKNGTNVEPAMS
ncbi:MAG TPA: methionine ABC transporter ATP-binding protein [Firmicutes bacterium]|nr:methionine ABC transporter ATP-binding protein [Bacillota bacterium]